MTYSGAGSCNAAFFDWCRKEAGGDVRGFGRREALLPGRGKANDFNSGNEYLGGGVSLRNPAEADDSA